VSTPSCLPNGYAVLEYAEFAQEKERGDHLESRLVRIERSQVEEGHLLGVLLPTSVRITAEADDAICDLNQQRRTGAR
jgi:hypothetical protein